MFNGKPPVVEFVAVVMYRKKEVYLDLLGRITVNYLSSYYQINRFHGESIKHHYRKLSSIVNRDRNDFTC